MATPGIQSVLQQMQVLSAQAGDNRGAQLNTAVGQGGFADALHSSIHRINQLQINTEQQIKAYEAGSSSVTLNDLMVDMQKAGLAFDAGVQVRNRLVTAYKEIMNMQI